MAGNSVPSGLRIPTCLPLPNSISNKTRLDWSYWAHTSSFGSVYEQPCLRHSCSCHILYEWAFTLPNTRSWPKANFQVIHAPFSISRCILHFTAEGSHLAYMDIDNVLSCSSLGTDKLFISAHSSTARCCKSQICDLSWLWDPWI